MPASSSSSEDFLRLLSKPGQSSSSTSSSSEISDTLKRLRRLILVEGIPEDATREMVRLTDRLIELGNADHRPYVRLSALLSGFHASKSVEDLATNRTR